MWIEKMKQAWYEAKGTEITGLNRQTSSLGAGNSIFLSMRPGLSSAESRISILLVAMMTYGWEIDYEFRLTSRCRMKQKPNADLDILFRFESVQLIQKLQHGTLYFAVPWGSSQCDYSGFIMNDGAGEVCQPYLGLPPDPLSNQVEPMESISSMKMMDGACSLEIENHALWDSGS